VGAAAAGAGLDDAEDQQADDNDAGDADCPEDEALAHDDDPFDGGVMEKAMGEMMVPFDAFVAVDWSGAKTKNLKGIAVAEARQGRSAPVLVPPPDARYWSRELFLSWLRERVATGERVLYGFDLSPAFPFANPGGYFPGLENAPEDAKSLWAFVEQICADEPHLGANSFFEREEIARHFRLQRGKVVWTGDAFEPGAGRLRQVERRWKNHGSGGQPSSCFNLVGAAQVGKSSLTGMRVLHRLNSIVPVWPYDAVPDHGPLIVEIYTTVAARAAGLPKGRSKIICQKQLGLALVDYLDSDACDEVSDCSDHKFDALISAAWMRKVANEDGLWNPTCMMPEVARTEGWTFGIS